jgi:hypothetical protein
MSTQEQYWLLAKMLKSYDQAAPAFNAGYTKGHTVYIWNVPIEYDGETHFRVFNGNSRYGAIDLTIEEAQQYVETIRCDGKTVKAANQAEIDNQYQAMLAWG